MMNMYNPMKFKMRLLIIEIRLILDFYMAKVKVLHCMGQYLRHCTL